MSDIASKNVSAEAYKPHYHRADRVEVLFLRKDEIYIREIGGRGQIILAHRWFSNTNGFYTNHWAPFQRTLVRRKNLKMIDVLVAARKYEIDIQSTTRWPIEEVK